MSITKIDYYQKKVQEYKKLFQQNDNLQWKKGDLACEIEIRYGQQKLQKYAKDVGEEYETLRQYKYISQKFKNDERSSNLSWNHHLVVSSINNPKDWLKKAEKNNLSVRQLKNAISNSNSKNNLLNINQLHSYDKNIFYYGDILEFNNNVFYYHKYKGEIRKFKNEYPTLTTLCQYYHPNGIEFSLREYANVQVFPNNFIFTGSPQEIRKQIGNAVSPKMSEYIIKKHIKGKTYLDLFCGCGGFTLGCEKLGKRCKWAIDINKYACLSFKKNFLNVDICCENICLINPKKIYKKIGKVDFIIGGSPCQGFSYAGLRLGFKDDPRNQLYLEFIKFLKVFKPKQFILENVMGILDYRNLIIKDFENAGYSVTIEIVKGLSIGMKQKRERVFFIGEILK